MSFAGWFQELPSGMTYRLWEQGGHERQPGEVALYTLEPYTARRLAVAQRIADALREIVAALADGDDFGASQIARHAGATAIAEWEQTR